MRRDVHFQLVVELELPPLEGGSELVLEGQTRHNLGELPRGRAVAPRVGDSRPFEPTCARIALDVPSSAAIRLLLGAFMGDQR